jgi:hypothetical protein
MTESFVFPNRDGEQMPVDARVANALEYVAHYLEAIEQHLAIISSSFYGPINPNAQLVTQLSHIREAIGEVGQPKAPF